MSVILEKEYKFYLQHLPEFLVDHLDQFVLIQRNQIEGFYNTYEDALRAGLKVFGDVPFFIKVIKESEEVHFFHQGILSDNG